MPTFPIDCENANVPTMRKKTKPLITKGALIKAFRGLVLISLMNIITKTRFSIEAISPLRFLTSKKKGHDKRLKCLRTRDIGKHQ